jgi:hypothetical protein
MSLFEPDLEIRNGTGLSDVSAKVPRLLAIKDFKRSRIERCVIAAIVSEFS